MPIYTNIICFMDEMNEKQGGCNMGTRADKKGKVVICSYFVYCKFFYCR